MKITTLTLDLDDEAMDILNRIIAIRFAAGASGHVEDVLLSILSSVPEGKRRFLLAGCEGKVIVEAID